MLYRALGTSTLKISEIGFGCMSLGENDKDNAYLLHRAMDMGINFFDTADLYQHGQNEITVGKAFKGKRNQVIIATKVGNQWKPDGSGWDWNPRKKYILDSVEESLKRLQTSFIDLYQLHGGTIDDPISETIEAFEILQQQGKIRYYGISSIRPNVIREYVLRSRIVSVMMQYSLLDRRPEETCLDLIQANHIGVLTRGSIAKGLLVDKAPCDYLNYTSEQVQKMTSVVRSFSGAQRKSAQTALRWVLQQPAVTAAIAGIRTEAQLDDVVQISNTPPLLQSEIQMLQQVLPVNYYDQHR